MKDLNKYIRVGIDYYKETIIPMTGEDLKVLKKWNKQTIIDDYGKDALSEIEKYEGFCFIPSHTNFQKVINGFYNSYEPLSYQLQPNGSWENIEKLLHHVFQEHYELGLDYLTILWQKPTQLLPVLCLVSMERSTGKTTFLDFLKVLFERNMTTNSNEDFRSRFNSDWSGKLVIAIEEVSLNRNDDSERIKNLSTAKYYKSEAKGKDKEEVEFFGKFILCSNHETTFVKVDSSEMRYWVRKLPVLGKNLIPNFLSTLNKEVPAFAHFLNSRKISAKNVSRMWFSKEQIHTEALNALISGNKTSLEKELEEMLKDEFAIFELTELHYTSKNLVYMLKQRGFVVSSSFISTILREKYNLSNEGVNSNYNWYRSDIYNAVSPNGTGFTPEKGRYFTIPISLFKE